MTNDLLPSCQGKTYSLRSLRPHDLDSLYRLATEPRSLQTWRLRGQSINPGEFAGSLHAGVHLQFVVCPAHDENVVIGLLQLFNHDPACGVAYLSAILDDSVRSSSTCFTESLELFLDYVFATLPLHKVYFETSEVAFPQLRHMTPGGSLWHVEGTLREHFAFGPQRVDLVVGAIYSREWLERRRAGEASSAHLSFQEFVDAIPESLKESVDWPESPTGGVRIMEDIAADSLWIAELLVWIESDLGRTVSADSITNLQELYSAAFD